MSNEMNKEGVLSAAQERYVEYISDAEKSHGHAHTSVLAQALGVKKPSVTQMIAKLVAQGIVQREGKELSLTERGRHVAEMLDNRHALLQQFMENQLGMNAKEANREACRLEHVVSPAFIEGLRLFLKRT